MQSSLDMVKVADVIEFKTWASEHPFSISSLKEEIETATGPDMDDESIGAEDIAKDKYYEQAQEVFDEFQLRMTTLGTAYPFIFRGDSICPNALTINTSSYIFCLALSLLPVKSITPNIRTPEFENLALEASKSYFGADGIRIGAPWKTTEFPAYRAVLERIRQMCAGLKSPIKETALGGGDGGWDILISKHFCDRNYPHLMAIGNCATSRSEWPSKGKDAAQDHFWHTYFGVKPRCPILEFLAIPFLMDDEERSRKCDTGHLLFDRLRLCQHSPNITKSATEWMLSKRSDVASLTIL